MMKIRYFLFASILLYLQGCNSPSSENGRTEKNTSTYTPKYREDWKKVESRILETWGESRVDHNTWQMEGSVELPLPYFSIHSGRNVLFYWDTYFTNVGLLLIDSLAIYAKNAADNQLAEIDQLGYVPNASEPWALNRSQTPFLSMMVREVYEKNLGDDDWLAKAYEGLKKEYYFWTDDAAGAIENHMTSIEGLQRFYHHATEEEALKFYDQIAPRFEFSEHLTKEKKLELVNAWLSEAESGMDFTPRFENRCHQFVAVDLNANLFMYEKNFAWMVKILDLKKEPNWEAKARKRKEYMNKYCWNQQKGMFMDYDFIHKRHSKVASIAAFYPLWAGLATKEQAAQTVKNLRLFELDYGPAICEKTKQEHYYQWDHPAGWPPLFI